MTFRLVARGFAALCAGSAVLGLTLASAAQSVDVDLASKIIVKIMLLDQDLQKKTGGKLQIGVIGSPQAVEAFTKLKGSAIDKDATVSISEVIAYESMPPAAKPTLIFVGEGADPAAVTQYTRGNQILSVTNVASFVERGVTLGIELENNKPKVLLNLTSSESEGLNWDPKILKISRTIR
ncbi:MAG: YfiR family protein [Myxococcota bacterium]